MDLYPRTSSFFSGTAGTSAATVNHCLVCHWRYLLCLCQQQLTSILRGQQDTPWHPCARSSPINSGCLISVANLARLHRRHKHNPANTVIIAHVSIAYNKSWFDYQTLYVKSYIIIKQKYGWIDGGIFLLLSEGKTLKKCHQRFKINKRMEPIRTSPCNWSLIQEGQVWVSPVREKKP